jgi:RND family efflux transporter MFP subunit
MSLSRQIVLSLLVVLFAAGGWYGLNHRDDLFGAGAARETGESPSGGNGRGGGEGGNSPSRGGAVPVVTARVGIDTAGTEIRAVGTLTAAEAVTIFPEVTGIVSAVEIEPGADVDKGQVLIRLNDADQAIAIDRAAIALDDARAALDRAERLAKTNNVTEVALSDARTKVRSAEIDLRSAELERAKRTIKAPFAGVVGLIPVSVGDLVSDSTALTTLDDVSRLTVDFDATERYAATIKVGHPVTGTAVGLPGREISGAISAVDSRVDPTTRVFKVEATLEEGIDGLKPGMSVTIAVDFEGEPQPTVPSLAIQWDRRGSFVWTIDGDKAKRAAVQIIGRRSGTVIVAGDVEAGDEVVVEGLQRMREGTGVRRVGGEPGPGTDDAVAPSGKDGVGGMPAAAGSDRAG